MSFTEPLGYLASALVLATFCMRDMRALRCVAIASNVAFIAYGAMADVGPVLLLHLLLLPVNVWRLAGRRASAPTALPQRRAQPRWRRRGCNLRQTPHQHTLEIDMTSTATRSHQGRRTRRRTAAVAAAMALAVAGAAVTPARAQAFDLERGNAVIDVVIPGVLPVLFANVAPGDASLVLRTTISRAPSKPPSRCARASASAPIALSAGTSPGRWRQA
jgi:hypothetical protein